MHTLHSLILIVFTAHILLGADTATPLGGTSRADHQDVSAISRRWPGMLLAVSSPALLIATIVGFFGVRCYTSIKGRKRNGPPRQHKRNMAEGEQSLRLDDGPDDDKELGAAAPDDDKEIKPAPAHPVAALWFTVDKMERREKARKNVVLKLAGARLDKIASQEVTKIYLEVEKWIVQFEKERRMAIVKFATEGFDKISKNVLKEKVPIEEDESTWFLAGLWLKVHEDYKTKLETETGKTLEQIGVANIPDAFQTAAWKLIKEIKLISKFMLDLEAVESRMRVAFRLVKPTDMENVMTTPKMKRLRDMLSEGLISAFLYCFWKSWDSKKYLATHIIPEQVEPWLKEWRREIIRSLDKVHPWTVHQPEFYKTMDTYKKELIDLLITYHDEVKKDNHDI